MNKETIFIPLLPTNYQLNQEVCVNFFDNNPPIKCIVDAIKFNNEGKITYDLIIETPEGDTFIDNVDSKYIEKY